MKNVHKLTAIAAAMAVAGFASAADNKTTAEKIRMLDTDGDGRVSAAEYTAKDGKTQADFARIDTDGDGYASSAEMEAHASMKHDQRSMGGMDERPQSQSTQMDQSGQPTQSGTATQPPPTDENN